MKTVIVYESLFGNTRRVADAIAEGARTVGEVHVYNVADASPAYLIGADLVFVGGPTHAHGMSWPSTREQAEHMADADPDLVLEPQGPAMGVREWLDADPVLPTLYAAFDTRADAVKWFTGSAATHIAKKLKRHGRTEIAPEGSFLAPDNDIDLSELDRAREWGASAARAALEELSLDYSRRNH